MKKIAVTREAILRRWDDIRAKLWCVPLVKMVLNENTDTVLTSIPPTKFLPNQPPSSKTIHNVYTLKTQPELVRYLHAAARFPTKLTLITAVKNN
jgi:hypothetical protein